MNQEPEKAEGDLLDWILGPKAFRVVVAMANGHVVTGPPMYKSNARMLHKKFKANKANGENIEIEDNTIDSHFVVHIGVIEDQKIKPPDGERMASVTIDERTKQAKLMTSEKKVEGLIDILTEGIVWALRAGQMHGDKPEDTKVRIEWVGKKLVKGIESVGDKHIEETHT